MKQNFFEEILKILRESVPSTKIKSFYPFYEKFKEGMFDFSSINPPLVFKKPSYFGYLNSTSPKSVPKRKKLNTIEGRAVLLHSIIHIEYSAIDLALDACYRFRDLPLNFYQDWLEVADDEIRHFLMLEKLLLEIGFKYGDFEVHDGLFEASQKSLTLLDRMALIPRYMEANGLDSNLALKNRIISSGISKDDELLKSLDIILFDEISHVRKGDVWFKYACRIANVDVSIYFDIVNSIYPNSFKQNKELNVVDRLKAGFSQDEINKLLTYKSKGEKVC